MAAGDVALTDPRIGAIASASNDAEIQPSQLALQQTSNASVREYAQMMVDGHTKLDRDMAALLASKGLQPEDNPISLQLKQSTPATVEALRGKSGADFDRAYIDDMVTSHQATLQMLDNRLIPSASDADVKTALQQTVRPQVVMHLQRATALRDQLANAR